MNYRLIIKDRATQDLRQLANYILVNGNAQIAGKFLDAAELTFGQLLKTPFPNLQLKLDDVMP